MIYFSLILGVLMFALTHLLAFKGSTKNYFMGKKNVIPILLNLIAGFLFVMSWEYNPEMIKFELFGKIWFTEPSFIMAGVFGFTGYPLFKFVVSMVKKGFKMKFSVVKK